MIELHLNHPPVDEEPEAKDPCFMCGADMALPGTGMVEGPDGEYICTECYSGLVDATYEMMKDREDFDASA